jgi:hypothetical protein
VGRFDGWVDHKGSKLGRSEKFSSFREIFRELLEKRECGSYS